MATTFVKIATVTVGAGGAANMAFTSIPSTYTDLLIKISARTSDTSGVWNGITASFNGTSVTTNWSGRELYGTGSAAASFNLGTSDQNAGGYLTTASATASTFCNNDFYIPNYTSSNNKSISTDSVTENNATAALAIFEANLWSNTAAITSVTLAPKAGNFAQYSTATLYGISKS